MRIYSGSCFPLIPFMTGCKTNRDESSFSLLPPLILNSYLLPKSQHLVGPSHPQTHVPVVVHAVHVSRGGGPVVGRRRSHSSRGGLLLLKEPLCTHKAGMPLQLRAFGKHWAKSQRNHWAMEYHWNTTLPHPTGFPVQPPAQELLGRHLLLNFLLYSRCFDLNIHHSATVENWHKDSSERDALKSLWLPYAVIWLFGWNTLGTLEE